MTEGLGLGCDQCDFLITPKSDLEKHISILHIISLLEGDLELNL